MINKNLIVGIFTLLVVLGAFGFVTASHIRSTSTVLTTGDGNNGGDSQNGDGHAGGNPDPTTGRILPADSTDNGGTGDGHAGGNPDPTM